MIQTSSEKTLAKTALLNFRLSPAKAQKKSLVEKGDKTAHQEIGTEPADQYYKNDNNNKTQAGNINVRS